MYRSCINYVMSRFQITISGDNFLFSRQIDYQSVKQISSMLIQNETSESQLPIELENKEKQTTKGLSLAEFLVDRDPKRTPDKIVTIAYYFWKYESRAHFEKQDILLGFELAMEPLPKNLTRDLSWTKKIGWVAESPQSKYVYYLTQEGKTAVESRFPKTVIKKTTIASTS